MKRILLFILATVVFCGISGCKKEKEYVYPATFVYENHTGHGIGISITSYYTPMEVTLEPNGTYSQLWVVGDGPVPFELREVKVTFDGKHTSVSKLEDDVYHNICHRDSYVSSEDKETGHGIVYTYTFTEEDYNRAVSGVE